MSEVLEQLKALKANTESTGILHEAQLTQIKYWILGLIPGSTELSISFNHKNSISFNVAAPSIKFKQKKKRLEMISLWTKELLGEYYLVEIAINDQLIFNSDLNEHRANKRAKNSQNNKQSDYD